MSLHKLIRTNQDAIKEIAKRYDVEHIRVFGSMARGDATDESDVDFLVDLPLGYDLLKQRIPLMQQLKQLLHREVDLIPEHEVNEHLRKRIFSESVEL